uniref:DUF2007 domain-containing protein n=1 Tax=candidate division WOR-3 bacterium TaxID=2052148 RepID=A0A7C4YH89_UNCW3
MKNIEDEFILFGKYNNLSEMKVIESLLKSENIPYFIKQESFGKIANITFDGIGEIKIFIHKDFFETAKKLISS